MLHKHPQTSQHTAAATNRKARTKAAIPSIFCPLLSPAFTLIEFLMVLVIAAVLFSAAGTAFAPLAQKYQVNAEVDRFISQLALARHTAISKGIPVTLCPAALKPDTCGKRNHWHQGSLMFEDLNRNRKLDGRDQVIVRTEPLLHTTVFWRAFRNRSYLQFNPSGLTEWQNGHFLFCPTNNEPTHARQLILNYAGRVYLSSDADNDGIHEGANGKPLQC